MQECEDRRFETGLPAQKVHVRYQIGTAEDMMGQRHARWHPQICKLCRAAGDPSSSYIWVHIGHGPLLLYAPSQTSSPELWAF